MATKIDIGIQDGDRKTIADGLSRLLADTYTLYLKTHNFHWNVTGPMFQTLHLMFETQYNELALAVDLIAERIRALGYPAPGTYSEYSKLSSIKNGDGVPKPNGVIRLGEGQEAVVRTARLIPAVDSVNDEPTADLLTQRMRQRAERMEEVFGGGKPRFLSVTCVGDYHAPSHLGARGNLA